MATRLLHSGIAAAFAACAVLLLASSSCNTMSSGPRTSSAAVGTPNPQQSLELSELWQKLAEIDAAITASGSAVLPIELRRASLALVRHLHDAVEQHRTFADNLDARPHELDLEAVEEAVHRCQELARTIEVRAGRITEQAALLGSRSSDHAAGVDDEHTMKFIEVFGQVGAIAKDWKTYIVDLHRDAIRPGRPAAIRVYHFHCLRSTMGNKFKALVFPEATELYENAWKHWSEREIQTARPDAAAEVLLAVCQNVPEEFPGVCRQLLVLADACLSNPPVVPQLDLLHETFTTFDTIVGERPENADSWRIVRPRLEARFVLTRALRVEDPDETIRLAGQARRLDPQLQPRVDRILRAAASSDCQRAVAENRGEDLFALYMDALASKETDEPERAGLPGDHDWWSQTSAVETAIKRRDLVSARDLLDKLGATEIPGSRAREYEHLVTRYYTALLDGLASSDLAAACDVCEDATNELPGQGALLSRCDEILFSHLVQQLGDARTSYKELGAFAIRARVGKAVDRMRTDRGIARCQDTLDRIEDTWSLLASSAKAPREAFSASFELARLRGFGDARAKEQGAESLWRLFADAKFENDEVTLLECIEVYSSSCPEAPVPATLQDDFFTLLENLAAKGDVEQLRRHTELFCKMFPAEAIKANALLQIVFAPSPSRAESALSNHASGMQAHGSSARSSLDSTATGNGEESSVASSAWKVHASIASALAGALLLCATIIRTMRSGLVAFRWYGAIALSGGLSLGFLFGSGVL